MEAYDNKLSVYLTMSNSQFHTLLSCLAFFATLYDVFKLNIMWRVCQSCYIIHNSCDPLPNGRRADLNVLKYVWTYIAEPSIVLLTT